MINKSVQSAVLGCNLKNCRMISVRFQGKPFNIMVIQAYDIEWFALEMNRHHSLVFEIASKYCISDSLVDHDGYTISSKGFLPTAVDIMDI